jgi:hypothetical protein
LSAPVSSAAARHDGSQQKHGNDPVHSDAI